MSVHGKVALVIGASRGIGAETARALALGGARVVVAARSADAIRDVADQITEAGGEASAVVADAANPSSVSQLIATTLDSYGRLDVAVNNAAANHPKAPLGEVTVEQFDAVVALNLRGLFVALREEISAMLRHPGGGAIINVASTAGTRAVPGLAGYTSTKHAAVGLTKVAALDYAQAGIRVNAVAPGPILTDQLARLPEHVHEQIAATVPMGRLGTTKEVADLIAWLASDQSAFVTGSLFSVDGGRLAAGA